MLHGGDLTEAAAAFGGDPSAWLDLSTGINPRPWPVPPGLAEAGLARLPEAGALAALIAVARAAYRVPQHLDLVAAPGTQALIQWLPRLAAPGEVAILGPTYGEHAAAWRLAGMAVREVDSLPAERAGHLVVCNPNNPDGRVLDVEALLATERAGRERGGWLVVDEAFADVVPEAGIVPYLPRDAACVVLRSFGKFYGLPGLRLGFAIAAPAIATRIAAALGPWAVAGPTLAVGRAALADGEWAAATRIGLARDARTLDALLAEAGLRPAGGTTLYRLVETADAAALHRHLASQRIWVRRFDWNPRLLRFGLPADAVGFGRLRDALAGFTGW